jgi:hypothetical protein
VRVDPLPSPHAQQEPGGATIGDLENGRELELAPGDLAAQGMLRLVATNHSILPSERFTLRRVPRVGVATTPGIAMLPAELARRFGGGAP